MQVMIAAPWMNWEKIFLLTFQIIETLSVDLINSLSIFVSLCVAPTPHADTYSDSEQSLLQQGEDNDSMSCLFPFALAEETWVLSNNRLMSCQPAENTQYKDQTWKQYMFSFLLHSQWLKGDCLCKNMKQHGGKKTQVCILLTENMSSSAELQVARFKVT